MIVGLKKGYIASNLSCQYIVSFDDGHEEFIFKRDKVVKEIN